MVDMTLCTARTCEVKRDCFRHSHLIDTKVVHIRQSVTDFSADTFIVKRRDCPYFIPVLSHD